MRNYLRRYVQNAQPGAIGGTQTRTYIYDGLSRLTSESNPESGTTTYTYDSFPAGGCGWTSQPGNLMLTTNGDGSQVCYVHDGLYRLIRTGTSQRPNSCRSLVYDSVSNQNVQPQPSGSTLSNLAGRLVEAETDNCTVWPPTSASMISDEWFSYDADGRPTVLYESIQNGGGFYHATATYWANGALETLGLFNSSGASLIPTMSYGLDGEGRPTTVSASSGQNPVTGVTYTTSGTSEPIGSLTQIALGSGDSDTYQYDTKTGRMTQYSFNVDGQSAVGNLTWNPNGTLGQLGITDPFNSQDNQTCTYSYDALARIGGTSCGSIWAQSFSYDAFGNISKSGSISWLPNYTNTTNQYQSGWNGVSYDGRGDLLNDTFNTYTWDAYGDLTSVNSATITYDALGRMVGNHNGTSQFVYPPAGGPILSSVSGQSVGTAIIPLPGGAFAVYTSSGLVQYNHADWLGSARLFSNPGRGPIPAMAYAPFGEGYTTVSDEYVQFTSNGNSWTISDGNNLTGSLDDFMFRRYNPTQGTQITTRWSQPGTAARNLQRHKSHCSTTVVRTRTGSNSCFLPDNKSGSILGN